MATNIDETQQTCKHGVWSGIYCNWCSATVPYRTVCKHEHTIWYQELQQAEGRQVCLTCHETVSVL